MTLPSKGLHVRLASRPKGWPTRENFEVAEVDIPAPEDGQILVRNVLMSVDPYMRGRMNNARSYVPPFRLGAPLDGGAVGEVIASRSDMPVGDTVLHNLGWREYAVLDAAQAARVDTAIAPAGAYLGALGMPGLTAYVGLLDIAGMAEGDTVFVSGAAGAVGAMAGQIAKLRGAARVVGSAGSAAKVDYLRDELGFDAAFDYHDGPIGKRLAEAAPDGIDVYFDNVGGDHLAAAISAMRDNGRIAVCGMISQYNNSEPEPGPKNLMMLVTKRLRMQGFIVSDHPDRRGDFHREVGEWVRTGRVRHRETVVSGLRNAPDAFLGMMRGENLGKMLVEL